MRSRIALALGPIALLSLTLGFAGCGSSSDNTGGGGSSQTGRGGTTGNAGTTGSAGTNGPAGTNGTAGTVGGAGTNGSGGSAAGTNGGAGTTGRGGSTAGTTGAGGGAAGTTGGGGNTAGTTGSAGASATGGRGGAAGGSAGAGGSSAGGTGGGGPFTLTSPTQVDGAKFAMKFTCAANNGTFGAGVNPQLDWTGVPAGTMSFAMTFIDTKLGESSPMGQHWAMWDVPATVRTFPEGTTTLTGDLAGAKQTNKYLAPCPSGNDTYAFTIYALSAAHLTVTGAEGTGVSNSAGVAKVLAALNAVTPLGTAKLTGTSGPMGK